jgi:hypothetical protein
MEEGMLVQVIRRRSLRRPPGTQMNLPTKKITFWASLIPRHCDLRTQWTAALLFLAACQGSLFAQSSNRANNETRIVGVSATHVIGLEGVRKNTKGQLTIENDVLKFQKNGGAAVEIRTASIISLFIGAQDRQVGGIPVALGRAATPFGGGRAIALFSHKKYDTLTLEYGDNDGGVHGAVFQLAKGNAKLIQDGLAANGVHLGEAHAERAKPSTEDGSENH